MMVVIIVDNNDNPFYSQLPFWALKVTSQQ